jgi:hypothetical protein
MDKARERPSASTVFPQPGSPDKTISVVGIVVVSIMAAPEDPGRQPGVLIHGRDKNAKTNITIHPTHNNNEIVPAIVFALGLSFHDRRPRRC